MRVRLVPPAGLALLAILVSGGRAPAQPMTFTHLAGGDGGNDSVDGAGTAARLNAPCGIAVDSRGNLYVADSLNHAIRKVTPSGEVSTLAGLPGASGSADGPGGEARFDLPYGVALDDAGNVYVADSGNHTVRVVTPRGIVRTLAGLAGAPGSADGRTTGARFNQPFALATDRRGDVWVADYGNSAIRRITPDGEVTTVAGHACAPGLVDGTGDAARFARPTAIVLEASGTLLVADNDVAIRRVTPAGEVTTLLGRDPAAGSCPGIATDSGGNLYILDRGLGTVKRLSPVGRMTTLAGVATAPFTTWGSRDGRGPEARFNFPWALTVDTAGTVFIADTGNHLIRKITPQGEVSTLVGLVGAYGYADGAAEDARFYFPRQIAVDLSGNVYVPDNGSHVIRKVARDGTVATLAGLAGVPGSVDGRGSQARFQNPSGVALDPDGNILVADSGNQTIRKIAPDGTVTTVAGLAGAYASDDGVGAAARFFSPLGIACDAHGNAFVADTGNQTVRKIAPDGRVTTLAGLPGARGSDDGPGSTARFDTPFGVAVDAVENVFVTDKFNGTIRRIAPDGVVTTLAGKALQWDHVDGAGDAARFYFPAGIAVDGSGNLWVTDSWNQAVRKVTPQGDVTTPAGVGGSSAGQVDQAYPVEPGRRDGTGPSVRFAGPEGIAVGHDGSLYVADTLNHAVRVARPSPLAAIATIDAAAGASPFARRLDGGDAVGWQWTMRRRPGGSKAELSDPLARNPTFVPDEQGLYVLGLVATKGDAASVSEVRFEAVGHPPVGRSVPTTPVRRVKGD